jgi:cytochrome P450
MYGSGGSGGAAPAGAGLSLVPRATLPETLAVVVGVAGPVLAEGVVRRRPRAVAAAEYLDLTRRAIKILQRLRRRYGPGPVLLTVAGRRHALILDPAHVRRVLDETPEPFATATGEKRAVLAHFEPQHVLLARGPARADRRRYNEAVLDSERPAHHLADRFLPVVHEEVERLLDEAGRRRGLDWDTFAGAWFRAVRRIVLGDGAADDAALTDLLGRLRADANWGLLRPRRRRLRERFYVRLGQHLTRAEPGSLAALATATPASDLTAAAHQVAHWLFAFDATAIATFRTLALLATHPVATGRARAEAGARRGPARRDLPYLRACVLDALRLWPTTPAVLRETTEATVWPAGTLPAGSNVVVFAPYFHRDDQRLPFADRFAPELWLGEDERPAGAPADWPLIPFSAGPAACPGRNLALFLASATLAALLDGRAVRLQPRTRLGPDWRLPSELNHASLRFSLQD